MKRLLLFITTFSFCILGSGQEPESFSYQALVHDTAGKIVAEKPVSLKISILTGSPDNSVVYSEKHHIITDSLGLVSMDIGDGTDKTGNFGSIDWSAKKYYLKVEIDPAGGKDYTDMGMIQIMNMPKSSSAKSSKKTDQIIIEDKLFVSRKYIGNYLDYRHTGPDTYNGPNLIWIKTTMDKTYGKISAYGKKCEFSVGNKLYLKRRFYSPGGVSGYWEYQIENDSSVYYKLTDFQFDHKVYTETWFN